MSSAGWRSCNSAPKRALLAGSEARLLGRLASTSAPQQVGNRGSCHRVHQFRPDFSERLEDESSLSKAGVRDNQPRLIQHEIPKQHQIEIERA